MCNFDHLLKKLHEALPKVTGLEKESIQYKINKIEEQKNDFDNNFNISTCKLVTSDQLQNKILIEKNLIKGYRKLIEEDSLLYQVAKDRLDISKYKVLTYEKMLNKITPFFNSKFEKVYGCVEFEFNKFEFDPIFEIEKVHFYVDSVLRVIYDIDKSTNKILELTFECGTEVEIFLISDFSIILGSILIPCDFFIDKENTFINIDFGNFNYIYTKVTFKKEIKLIRKNAGVVCAYKNGHGLETQGVYSPKLCGVCHTFLPMFISCYKCFRCKFVCHKKCSDVILFACKMGNVESKTLWHNNYGISHTLEKKDLSGFRYCYHCGERIHDQFVLNCTRCDHSFHLSCEDFLFDSCQLDLNLRTIMSKFIPKRSKINYNEQNYKIQDFQLLRTLGKGNFGRVIIARYKGEEIVALKIIRKDQMVCTNEAKYVDIERKVLKIGTQCHHPFLTHMYYCFQDKKNIYFALEYLSGGDLFHHVSKKKFSLKNIKLFACEILMGLEFLHKNEVIYRDLKLNNILLTRDGHIKLCDFGLCKENMKPQNITYTFCGTLDTIAPEIIKNEGYTNLVDLWSYGVILYELYTKTPPFSGITHREICKSITESEPDYKEGIPEDAVDLIKKLLVKDPSKRITLNEMKTHKYFDGTNWNDVFNMKITPDFIPGSCISNFDSEFISDLILLPKSNEAEQFDEFFENIK
ncbi:protein kinase C-like [Vairimorpha necatrix]|uniref:protein kinase C n=1 Tax=Vairimorpha necatrix TaxID=6039 RepID=A0AAX4JB48_9MICR